MSTGISYEQEGCQEDWRYANNVHSNIDLSITALVDL
jgi:hypothetical protein